MHNQRQAFHTKIVKTRIRRLIAKERVESKIMLRGCFSVAPVLATKETKADLELCNQAEQAGHRDPKTIFQ